MSPEKFRRITQQLSIGKGTRTYQAVEDVILGDVPPIAAAKQAGVTKQCVYDAISRIESAKVEYTELEIEMMRLIPGGVGKLLEKYE